MYDRTFKANVLRMTLMHCIIAFASFLLHFQLKYLEGSIFVNSNYCAVSALAAILSGGLIYAFLGGIKPAYFLGFAASTIGSLAILHRINDAQDQKHLLKIEQLDFYRQMPSLIFLTKFGISMSLIATQLATMTEERIYPLKRRTEALAVSNFFSNMFASLSPLISEIDEPWPIVCIIVIVLIALPLGLTIDIPPGSPHEPQRKRELQFKKQQLKDLKDEEMRQKRKEKLEANR